MTPANLPAADKVKFALWGDSRENADQGTEQIIALLLNDITDWDFQVHSGDFTHAGQEEDWERSLGYKDMGKVFQPGKFFMCTSNHDDELLTYNKYTAGILPTNTANNTTHFYAKRRGNVHVIFCDAYFTDPKVMQTWLDDYLSKNVKEDDWLIGVWHNPCYEDLTYKSSYLNKCQGWLDSFERYGGDFILHGHAHTYLRTNPLLADGSVDTERGMVHIINGTGGASWKKPQKYVEKTMYAPDVDSFASVTFITIEGNTATIETVDARPGNNLNVFDTWVWEK